MNFVIYADNTGHFHWRLHDDTGTPIAASAVSYTSEAAARTAAADVHDHAGTAGTT
jgi:uncharacterized protein YegP (UPF0339 family)